MRRGFKKIKSWKKVLPVLLIGCTGWMISACAPYYSHTSLMMDNPSPSPYPYAYYDNNYGYGPYNYPSAYYGEPFFYGNDYGGYKGTDPAPSMPSHRMIR